jgi:NAD(P)-dependent dehydrogenase (short-subunit alcohol dehydrogenase family)
MAEGGPERVGEKVAIVTAAGSGMGAACARELASRGYTVALISPSGKAEDLAKELGASASRARSRRWPTWNPSSEEPSTGTGASTGSLTAPAIPPQGRSWSSPTSSGTRPSTWCC